MAEESTLMNFPSTTRRSSPRLAERRLTDPQGSSGTGAVPKRRRSRKLRSTSGAQNPTPTLRIRTVQDQAVQTDDEEEDSLMEVDDLSTSGNTVDDSRNTRGSCCPIKAIILMAAISIYAAMYFYLD